MLFSSIGFGLMPLFAKAAYASGADPLTLLFSRFFSAGLALFVVARLRRLSFPRGKGAWRLFFMGALCYAGMAISYFVALIYLPSGMVAILLYLFPAFVTLGAFLIFGTRPTGAQLGAVGLAGVGMLFVVGPVTGQVAWEGVLLGLSSAVFYSAYILLGSRAPAGSPLAGSAIVIAAASVTLFFAAALNGFHFPTTFGGWLAVALLSFFSTVIAVTAFLAGLSLIGPVDASTIATLDPVIAVLVGAVAFGETFTPMQALGGTLVLAAVLWLVRASRHSG